MKVLHCMASYDSRLGGSVQAPLSMCKYLTQAGRHVEIVAPYSDEDATDYLQQDYPEVIVHRPSRCFPKRYSNSLELLVWLFRNLQRFQLVEIHGIWVLSTFLCAFLCRLRGIPYLVNPHGSLDPFDLQKHARLKRILGPVAVRWLLAGSAGVKCTTRLEAERLETYGSRPASWVVPLSILLAESTGDGPSFRRRWSIPEQALVVLFLSRIDYKKGLNFLIPALAGLRAEFPTLWFVLAGSGEADYTRQVQRWLEDTGTGQFTSRVGFLAGQDKLDALDAADIFALTSLNENFGIVNVEAMHAGLPLVISDEVYIRREIQEAGAGLICKPETVSVTTSLRLLLSDEILRRQMGESGRKLVGSHFRPEAVTRLLMETYQRVLG